MDIFPTPEAIADAMLDGVVLESRRRIADFASGDGELLKRAAVKWKGGKFIATDIRRSAVRNLRRDKPAWRVGRCDFLDARSRGVCGALRGMLGGVSLVLLNPPFSCRGAQYFEVSRHGMTVRCSWAVAFILTAIDYLEEKGQLVAVVPAGALTSERDREAWRVIRAAGSVDVLRINKARAFRNAVARTVIVRFRAGESAGEVNGRVYSAVAANGCGVTVTRGAVQMHAAAPSRAAEALPLVHSTSLQAGAVKIGVARYASKGGRSVRGPVVLLPRVGAPRVEKAALYLRRDPVLLSDCVLALSCGDAAGARRLWRCLRENWALVEESFGGTCAPFITVERMRRVISELGFSVSSG